MLRIIASRHNHFQRRSLASRTSHLASWHLRTVVFPRRSITGRLLWGTVLRRLDGNKWIYKAYIENFDGSQYRKWARALIRQCRKTASPPPSN